MQPSWSYLLHPNPQKWSDGHFLNLGNIFTNLQLYSSVLRIQIRRIRIFKSEDNVPVGKFWEKYGKKINFLHS